ncbi:SpoIIE family protein phosphatase [Calidifontibacillus oryziterrae]|uniref:SpoIIE family protein phosphatase n=1 Tax=Calidifontibacillus oryziterrae TaxID=1191699 RepID=UPI0002D55E1A|nr:PP2C family protein-serine/threonine phosphatase [Calidifontibacillus oryziterrae]
MTDSRLPRQNTIEQQLELMAKVFKYSIEGIFLTDLEGNIQMVNRSFESITGYFEAEVIGSNPRILKSGKQELGFYKELWIALERDGQWQGELINKRKNGELYYQRTTIATIKNSKDEPISYCAIFSDVTEAKEAERKLASDLELARQLQKSVLSKPLKNDHIDIDGVYLPSAQLAGDMYAWYQINPGKYGVILFDIMGHGVASSLVSMSIRSLLRGIITRYVKPEKVLQELNEHMQVLYRENEMSISYFFTAIYLVIDLEENSIEYASAGHPPGLLISDDHRIKYLDKGCPPIGMVTKLSVETEKLSIIGSTQIILYTDGLTDSFGRSTYENIEKLKNIVSSINKWESSQLLQSIIESIDITNRRFSDDVTVVAITIK